MIKQSQADALIKQAQDQAYVSRQATKDAAMKAAQATREADAAAAAVTPPGTKRVVYVPEIVKHQLREEIKREVLRTAQRENWASPGAYPEWASRIHFSGDFRLRTEGILYPKGNAPGQFFPNFNALNTGTAYDLSEGNPVLYPTLNSNADRDEMRIQARLAMDADLPTASRRVFVSRPAAMTRPSLPTRRSVAQPVSANIRSGSTAPFSIMTPGAHSPGAISTSALAALPIRFSRRPISSGTMISALTAPRCRRAAISRIPLLRRS